MSVLLIANYSDGVGGIAVQVKLLYEKLLSEGIECRIFSTKGSVPKRIVSFFRLLFTGKKYDVFFVHACSFWGFLPAVYGVTVGKLLKKRIVLTFHGGEAGVFFNRHTRLVKTCLSRTDYNIVLSGFLGRIFDEYQIPYEVIPNIVELNSSKYRERSTLKPSFICIRSHEPVYNIPCILNAFRIIQSKVPHATLILAGDGSLHDSLVRMSFELGLKDVVFTGHVNNESIYALLEKADIMLSSSNADNMPVSILEAMNAGLLVISSDVGGIPYMVEDKKCGILFRTGDYNDLAEQMLWALDHQKECLTMIQRAKEELKRYTWHRIKDELMRLLG